MQDSGSVFRGGQHPSGAGRSDGGDLRTSRSGSIAHGPRFDPAVPPGGYVWWYVLRPVWSALLGSVVVVAVNTGLISIGDTTTSSAGVTMLVTMGALAGMYTDQALQRLQPFLGAVPGSQVQTHSALPPT